MTSWNELPSQVLPLQGYPHREEGPAEIKYSHSTGDVFFIG